MKASHELLANYHSVTRENISALHPSMGWDDTLEEEMANHSGILARRISWTEEPGGLQSMGSQRVRHD